MVQAPHGKSQYMVLLVAERLDDLLVCGNPLGNLGVLENGGLGLGHLQLALVEGLTLHLPLGLQGGHNVLVLPANLSNEDGLYKNYPRKQRLMFNEHHNAIISEKN